MRARERRRLLLSAVALMVLVVAGGLAALAGDDPRAPAPAPAVPVAVADGWVTTPDGTQLLAAQKPIPFGDPAAAPLTVTVDPTREYQVVDGFGASITDSSASVLYRLDPAARDAAMVQLFDPRRGAGLSYLRQPMGASDFVDGQFYTYDDVPPGQTDYTMAHFSIEHDRQKILPLLRRAKALNPKLTIMATPWSAPAWMKTNGSLVGGSLIDDPRIYQAYALYFVKFLQAYAAAGVPIDAVTVQNEPQHETADYPGMLMPPAQEAAFISVLGPALRRAGLHTSILAFDHNWALAPGDAAAAPHKVPAVTYAESVLSDPAAAPWVGGVAFHCYSGQPSAQTQLHQAFPRAEIVTSECSGYRGARETPAATFARSLSDTAEVLIGALRNWSRAVLTWNVALGPGGGPHHGGCSTCTGLITADRVHGVTFTAEYYALASVSRLVRPGAVRIASTSFPSVGGSGGLITAAFRTADGSIAVIALNAATSPRTFAVRVGDRAFTTSLAAGALGAYSWPGSATPDR